VLLKGTFTPSAKAGELSRAQHFNSPSTPVIARFSSSTGIPNLPDTDPNGNPRGFALRFMLAETPRRVHTDIVSHSVDAFPDPTVEGAVAFFKSLTNGTVGDFVGSHPAALAFVQAPKPTPSAFGREKYFSVSAFKLVAADGKATFVRYRFLPAAGEDYLDEEALKGKGPEFLFDGVPAALQNGPIVFKLAAQVAAEGDVTDDSSVHWPEEREVVELGSVSLETLDDQDEAHQKTYIFDPIPRVDGVEPSGDPLLDLRASLYLISGRQRRAA
jgi:catalase